MNISKCEICFCSEDIDYIHLLFYGTTKIYIQVCQACVDKLFKEKIKRPNL